MCYISETFTSSFPYILCLNKQENSHPQYMIMAMSLTSDGNSQQCMSDPAVLCKESHGN